MAQGLTPEQRERHALLLRTADTESLLARTANCGLSKVRSIHQHHARTGHLSHSQRAVLCTWLVETT